MLIPGMMRQNIQGTKEYLQLCKDIGATGITVKPTGLPTEVPKEKTIALAKEADDVNTPNTKLVALKDSTSQAFAEAVLDKTTLYTTGTYDEAVEMVLKDKVQAMIADYPICVVSVFRYPEAGLLSVVTQLTYEPIGIAIPANDPLLMNWTTNTLNSIEASGQLDELRLKWFARGSWLEKLK